MQVTLLRVAAIPTCVYIGDDQIDGGEPSVFGARPRTEGATGAGFFAGLTGLGLGQDQFGRAIPYGLLNQNPGSKDTVPLYKPYWDGAIVATSGTATVGSTSTSLEHTGAGWTVDVYIGRRVYITGGTGSGQNRRIVDNDADTLEVDDVWGTIPDATSTYEIRGDWVVYHHTDSTSAQMVPFAVVTGAKGDRWYATEKGGVTPMTMLMNAWFINHLSSPYFRAFKFGSTGSGCVGQWDAGAAWDTFVDHYAAAEARELHLLGNTLDVQQVIFDATYSDIKAGVSTTGGTASTFGVALQDVITALRAKFPTAHIQVVRHHDQIYNEGQPNKARLVGEIVFDVVALNDNCSVFDMGWAEFAAEVPIAPHWFGATIPATERQQRYELKAYVEAGTRLYNSWQGAIATAPAATPGAGLTTIPIIGDSQVVGTIGNAFPFNDAATSKLGAGPTGYVKSGEYVYNGQTNVVELYDVSANANTLGTVGSGTFGPELTLLPRLHETQTDGVCVWKFGASGHSLTEAGVTAGALGAFKRDAGDDWPEMQTAWDLFKVACPVSLNRIPDVPAIVLVIGDNDCLSDAAATEFAAEIGEFIDDVRELFSTRTNGVTPVILLQPPAHVDAGGLSQHGTASARATVRAAIAALATTKARVTVLTANSRRYEIKRTDYTHYSGESIYNIGYDVADAIVAANDGTQHVTAVAGETVTAASAVDYDATATAMADTPDVAAYTTPDGLSVQRRSVADMIALEEHQRQRAARARGLTRTRSRFS